MREQKESYVKAKSQRAEGSKGCRRCRGGQDLALHLAKGPKKKMLNMKSTLAWQSTNQAPRRTKPPLATGHFTTFLRIPHSRLTSLRNAGSEGKRTKVEGCMQPNVTCVAAVDLTHTLRNRKKKHFALKSAFEVHTAKKIIITINRLYSKYFIIIWEVLEISNNLLMFMLKVSLLAKVIAF